MKVYDAILSRRSIRRFQQKKIPLSLLKNFVNAARIAPSAANLQPLEFFIVNDESLCSKVFETLSWAAYIKPAWAPSEDERPVAYIIILVKNPKKNPWIARDASYAAENIMLTAESEWIGSCVMCKIDREKLHSILELPDEYQVDSTIALGYKSENPVIEDIKDNDVKYWRDKNEVLHVPKRKLEDIIHIDKF